MISKFGLYRKSVQSGIILSVLYLIYFIGLVTSYSELFVALSPIVFLLNTVLIIHNHREKKRPDKYYTALFIITILILAQLLVSNYISLAPKMDYLDILNTKLFKFPFMIIVVILSGIITSASLVERIRISKTKKIFTAGIITLGYEIIIDSFARLIGLWKYTTDTSVVHIILFFLFINFLSQGMFFYYDVWKFNKLALFNLLLHSFLLSLIFLFF